MFPKTGIGSAGRGGRANADGTRNRVRATAQPSDHKGQRQSYVRGGRGMGVWTNVSGDGSSPGRIIAARSNDNRRESAEDLVWRHFVRHKPRNGHPF
jgi:hypothetical protein